MRIYNKQTGFSLIELMIVIAIIGILAAIAVPSYQSYVMKAKTAKLLNYIQAGQTAVEEYVASTGDSNCNDLVGPTSTPNGLNSFSYGNGTCWVWADGLPDDFGGSSISIWYNPSINGDGSISWQCWYLTNNSLQTSVVPKGCLDGGAA